MKSMVIACFKVVVLALAFALAFTFGLNAQSPMINYQGKIADSEGHLIEGTVSIQFKIYSQEIGGTPVWQETHTSVQCSSGIFNVLLGSTNPIPTSVFSGNDRWLGITIDADPEMSPRQQIVSVGYALRADKANDADMLDGQHASTFLGKTEKAADSDKLDGMDSSEFANANHDHDAEYVNVGEVNSITGDMIMDGTIQEEDISFPVPNGHSLDAVDGDPEDAVYVDAEGRVGIGTRTPAEALQVGQYNDAFEAITLAVSGSGTGRINFYDANTTEGASVRVIGISTGAMMHFAYRWNTDMDRVTFDLEHGNVGIGVTNPSHPLQMGSGAYCNSAGVWTDASSREYKENIADLTLQRAREALVGLNPVTYNYRVDKDEEYAGFIAEDVPELVASKDRKGLSPMDIIAVLTKVVQEQEKRIEALEKHIVELDSN